MVPVNKKAMTLVAKATVPPNMTMIMAQANKVMTPVKRATVLENETTNMAQFNKKVTAPVKRATVPANKTIVMALVIKQKPTVQVSSLDCAHPSSRPELIFQKGQLPRSKATMPRSARRAGRREK